MCVCVCDGLLLIFSAAVPGSKFPELCLKSPLNQIHKIEQNISNHVTLKDLQQIGLVSHPS